MVLSHGEVDYRRERTGFKHYQPSSRWKCLCRLHKRRLLIVRQELWGRMVCLFGVESKGVRTPRVYVYSYLYLAYQSPFPGVSLYELEVILCLIAARDQSR